MTLKGRTGDGVGQAIIGWFEGLGVGEKIKSKI